MFKVHASFKNGNKEITAVSYEGIYSVCAYVNGILVGAFDTEDMQEAMEVYGHNVDLMLA